MSVLLRFIFIFLFCASLFAADFGFDQQKVSFLYRDYDINSKSLANPGLLVLDDAFLDLSYYSYFWYVQDFFSVDGTYKLTYFSSTHDLFFRSDFETLYFSMVPVEGFFVDVGKKELRWGTSYAWDLMSRFDRENRLISHKVDLKEIVLLQYFSDQGQSYSFSGFVGSSDYVAKMSDSFDDLDVNFFIFNYGKPGGGLSLSTVVSDGLELHFEGLLQEGSLRYYPVNLVSDLYQWRQKKDNDSFYGQYVLGGQYTTLSEIHLIFEYYHSALGLNDSDYALMQDGLKSSLANQYDQYAPLRRQFLFDYHSYYDFASFRQDYLFFRAQKTTFLERVNVEMALYQSLEESSAMLLPTIEYVVSDQLMASFENYIPLGDSHSEFRRFYDFYTELSFFYVF